MLPVLRWRDELGDGGANIAEGGREGPAETGGRGPWFFVDTGGSRLLAHRPTRPVYSRQELFVFRAARRDRDARRATAETDATAVIFGGSSKVEVVLSYLWWPAVNCLAFSEQGRRIRAARTRHPQPSRNLVDFLVSSLIRVTPFL